MRYAFIASIDAIAAADWDRLAATDYPFTRHAFLQALEATGAVGAESGWQPEHLIAYRNERPVLALPLYRKTHSYGEYVFDWAWADAWQRAGLAYYPKLLSAIPFTPCTGPRWLFDQDESLADLIPGALAAIRRHAEASGASGWHGLFASADVAELVGEAGAPVRLGCQFHWRNRGYRDFAEFLATFASRKRKNIVKERRRVSEQGFRFRKLEATEISPAHWQFFYDLYQLTYLKRSGHTGYLPLDFFLALGRALPEHCLMVIAERDDQMIAASLYFKDTTTLYGRYWGCLAEFDFLHFETCYYQGIDYAIDTGLTRFDGGAQGEHKLARGFEPELTYSNHWVADARFRPAVADFLQQETEAIHAYAADCRAHLPYAQAADR